MEEILPKNMIYLNIRTLTGALFFMVLTALEE